MKFVKCVSRLFRTTFLNQCPNCAKAKLYSHVWHIRPKQTCDACLVRFERDAGNWLMPTAMAYFLAAIFAFLVGFFLVKQNGFFAGLEWVLIVATLLFVAVIYKPCKSFWIWMLWMMGQVRADSSE